MHLSPCAIEWKKIDLQDIPAPDSLYPMLIVCLEFSCTLIEFGHATLNLYSGKRDKPSVLVEILPDEPIGFFVMAAFP